MMESCQKDGIGGGQTPIVNHFNKEGSVPLNHNHQTYSKYFLNTI